MKRLLVGERVYLYVNACCTMMYTESSFVKQCRFTDLDCPIRPKSEIK